MSERTMTRAIARKLYERFSRNWRRDVRLAGQYGKPGTGKPTFNAWWKMHLKQLEQMRNSTPADVREYLSDPWADGPTAPAPRSAEPEEKRGVLTIPIAGDEE